MQIFLIWCLNFVLILLIALQTKNVISNKYLYAALTSGLISAVQVLFVRAAVTMPLPLAILVMSTSGAIGIVVGMLYMNKDSK